MYKITIKGMTPGMFSYAQDKEEITESKVVVDEEGNETIEHVGTGKFKTVDFETEDIEEAKAKYVELMKNHYESELNLINDITETVTVTVDVESQE